MTSPLLETLVSDPLVDAALSDEALVAAMVKVEAALARVQGALGVIPKSEAQVIDRGLKDCELAVEPLRLGMLSAGVPVPALVAELRKQLPKRAAGYLHWGATSQDIVDTAFVLCLRDVLDDIDDRIFRLGQLLADRTLVERATPMLARTRLQQAVPTTLGLRFAGWLMPLIRYRQRLREMRPRLLMLQFGGAAGNLSMLGDAGPNVAASLAAELELALPPMPWHAQRDGFFELAAVVAGLCGTLGKIGLDTLLASQNEVAEFRESGGGGSSTMPNKANPVRAETLVTIARRQAGLLSTMQQSLVHAQDRDGSAWSLEWATLPDMISSVASALRHALELVENLEIDHQRLETLIDADGGLAFAESISFALAEHMPRDEAQTLVGQCAVDAKQRGGTLLGEVQKRVPFSIDVDDIRKRALDLPAAEVMIDAVLKTWQGETSGR